MKRKSSLYVVSTPSAYTSPSSFEPRKWSMVMFWQGSSLPSAPVFADPAQPMEDVNPLDKPKMVRRRRRSFGRSFWSHLGEEYQLKTVDGYATD